MPDGEVKYRTIRQVKIFHAHVSRSRDLENEVNNFFLNYVGVIQNEDVVFYAADAFIYCVISIWVKVIDETA